MAMQHVHCNARDPMHLEACILNQERRRDDPSRMVPEPERPSGSRDDPFAAPDSSCMPPNACDRVHASAFAPSRCCFSSPALRRCLFAGGRLRLWANC